MTLSVHVDSEALEELEEITRQDKTTADRMIRAIDALETLGTRAAHVKKIVGTKNGWRLDVGRYRALFSLDADRITIWRIVMEKDTKKDYRRWISGLSREGKFRF